MTNEQNTSNRVTKMIMRASARSRLSKGLLEATQTRRFALKGFKAFVRSAKSAA